MTGPHPASIEVGGTAYLRDHKGALVPIATIRPADLLIDEAVRGIVGRAAVHSAAIAAFKADTFLQVTEVQALLAQQYEVKLGGAKGNTTLLSFDGCAKVQVQVADLIDFGPELLAAKGLIDECLVEWSGTAGVELQSLVNRVFSVDKQGQINRAELFMLMRSDIQDPRWLRAMDAIRDSIRVIGSKVYLRFYQRDAGDAPWRAVSIDIATA